MKNLFKAAVVAALFAGTANADQGVTDNQVLIGSNQDMSGPFAHLERLQWKLLNCILMK